jgi:peroxidase
MPLSMLLDSKGSNKAEKERPPNVFFLHAFYVIDSAKKELEAWVPWPGCMC